jgi:hypothetical protein
MIFSGQEITTLIYQPLSAGSHEIQWDARDIPSGIYLYQLKAGDPSKGSKQGFVETKKMILLK